MATGPLALNLGFPPCEAFSKDEERAWRCSRCCHRAADCSQGHPKEEGRRRGIFLVWIRKIAVLFVSVVSYLRVTLDSFVSEGSSLRIKFDAFHHADGNLLLLVAGRGH